MTIHPREDLLRAARAQARPRSSNRPTPPARTSNGSSPGSPPRTGGASSCATSASPKTTPGCAPKAPPSTYAPSSTTASPTKTAPGPWPDRPEGAPTPLPVPTTSQLVSTAAENNHHHTGPHRPDLLPHRRPCRRSSRPGQALVQRRPRYRHHPPDPRRRPPRLSPTPGLMQLCPSDPARSWVRASDRYHGRFTSTLDSKEPLKYL